MKEYPSEHDQFKAGSNLWNPTLDGDFVARYGSEQLADGSFVHVPIISGANSDEGTAFSPAGVNTEADLESYLNRMSDHRPMDTVSRILTSL